MARVRGVARGRGVTPIVELSEMDKECGLSERCDPSGSEGVTRARGVT